MDIIVKKSRIEGKGVFASRNFKSGEIVIKWDISRQLSTEQEKEIPEKEKKYIAHTGAKIILQKSPAKYVNHSCNPNTHVENFCDMAIRDIKKGEEITSDYNECLGPEEILNCNCKSKNCKKSVNRKQIH